MRTLLVFIVALSMTTALAPHSQAQTAQTGVDAANKELMDSFKNKDAAGIAALYSESAVVLPPNAERMTGRENIQKMWQSWVDAGLTDLALTPVVVEESGDLAYEEGTYSLKVPGSDGQPMQDVGKYVVVWKKGPEGTWQLHRDIFEFEPAARPAIASNRLSVQASGVALGGAASARARHAA